MEVVPDMGAIVDPARVFPLINSGHGDAEFPGQERGAFRGSLNVPTRGGGGELTYAV